ncbi:putative phage abortive infection protein [Vibrio harveyi]|uniref:putative phage abortive infection protein n=1 Tax=Vibrio harveyi TaxID=669 RepID=UPI0012AD3FA5|nr:putative phage abortive infection protein [Vibrio harveyi]
MRASHLNKALYALIEITTRNNGKILFYYDFYAESWIVTIRKISIAMGAAVVAIVFGYLGVLLYLTSPISSYSMSSAAILGDSFGIVNALFSGSAFAGLIVTILLQREELRESREIFKAQKFEDAFYRILDFYRNNLNEISITVEKEKLTGIAALSYQLRKFQSINKLPRVESLSDSESDKLFEKINYTLIPQSRYLGTLESLLSLVIKDVSNIEENDFYIKLIASQLTVHEIKYIFYRCLSMDTDSDLVELIDKSKLLHHRIKDSDIPKEYIKLYNKKHGDSL